MSKKFLFITAARQRADSIGMVQSGREVTPALNRLAAGGRWFARAYTACPLGEQARAVLNTGLYSAASKQQGESLSARPTLQTLFKDAGYRVGQVGISYPDDRLRQKEHKPDFFYDQSDYKAMLDECNAAKAQRHIASSNTKSGADAKLAKKRGSKAEAFCSTSLPEPCDDSIFISEALYFLNMYSDKPFALFLNLCSCPVPLADEEFKSVYDPKRVTLPSDIAVAKMAEGKTEADKCAAWAACLNRVSYTDYLLGRLIGRARQLDHETTIIYTSACGEALEMQGICQSMAMSEALVRVPLIISSPAMQTGKSMAAVSHLDVLPTVCALAGLSAPAGADGILLPDAIPPDREVFAQYQEGSGQAAMRMLAGPHYKYIWSAKRGHELYELEKDHLEAHNLAQEETELCVALYRRCREFHLAHGDNPEIWQAKP